MCNKSTWQNNLFHFFVRDKCNVHIIWNLEIVENDVLLSFKKHIFAKKSPILNWNWHFLSMRKVVIFIRDDFRSKTIITQQTIEKQNKNFCVVCTLGTGWFISPYTPCYAVVFIILISSVGILWPWTNGVRGGHWRWLPIVVILNKPKQAIAFLHFHICTP